MTNVLRFAFVVFLATALAAPARAAGNAQVDGLIQKGLELRRAGKPEQALEMFRRAHELSPSPRTFGQMGLVEATLERWVDAETHLSVSLANPDDGWVAKNRAFLDGALALSRQHLGDLVVSGTAGAEITVAGKSVGTLPAVPAVRLVEGNVVVSAEAPGFKPLEQTVTIRAGARTPLRIVLAPLPAPELAKPARLALDAPPPPPEPRAAEPAPRDETAAGNASHWHTWAGAALGLAGLGLVGWGVVDIILDGRPVCSGCTNVYGTKKLGLVLTGVGGAALAAGAAIFFTGPSSDGGGSVALGVAPGSLQLRGRF